MVTAGELRQSFMAHLDSQEVGYVVWDVADNIIRLSFAPSRDIPGGGFPTCVFIDFDEAPIAPDLWCVHFVCQDCARCREDRLAEALVRMNHVNMRYRWAKFWYDPYRGTITADADAIIFLGTTGEECLQYSAQMARVVEQALADFGDLVDVLDADADADYRGGYDPGAGDGGE